VTKVFNKLITFLCIFHFSMGHAQFSLDQIPAIENKKTLNLVAETGFWTEHLKENMLPKFTAQTGIEVNVITTSLDNMYSLQTESLIEGAGRYDLLTMEAGWAKEWASKGLTVPLSELANLYDPSGERGINNYLEAYYPSLLNILSYHGEVYAIPYNNYVMGNHYRADLFRHPKEKFNFKVKYGYSLAPPTDMQKLKDVSAFFTRIEGDKLGDKILEKPFYGIALMSGNRPHINDEFSSILWSLGGYWMKPEYNQNNKIKLFKLPPDNTALIRTANIYQDLMPYAYPADQEFAFKQASSALANGDVAMWPFAYNNLWNSSFKVESNVAGAQLAVTQVPGGKPYNGAYAFAVAYDSVNPQAAYWLLKYMGSFDAQYAYALGGGNPCRIDVATAPELQTDKLRHIGGAFSASHKANLNWSTEVLNFGHFTSTAMGDIYPELSKSCFKLSNNSNIDSEASKLINKIEQIQNRYGEVPVIRK
jgi:multiple sugar transport system substrate-binding protein